MCPYALLDLHLWSMLSEEEYVLIKAKCELINTQVQVKICRRGASPILVYGGATCESSPSGAQSRKVVMRIVFIDLKWIKRKAKVCPFALLDLHLLGSRLREEEYLLIKAKCELINTDRKSTRLNSSHSGESRMPSSA